MYCTYIHIRNDTDKVFYVGEGRLKRAYAKNGRNKYWHNIVKICNYTIKILATWNTKQEAQDHEKILVECFKDLNNKLTNIRNGGGDGWTHTPETLKNLSKAQSKRDSSTWAHMRDNRNPSKRGLPRPNQRGENSTALKRDKSSWDWMRGDNHFAKNLVVRQKISQTKKTMPPETWDRFRGANNGRAKKVKCIETGVVYTTIREAVKWLKLLGYTKACTTAISGNAEGKRKSAYKHHWSYVDVE